MKKFLKSLLLGILVSFLVAGSAMALPVGTALEGVFNNIAVDGDNDVDVYTDMLNDVSDNYWNIGATGTSAATFIIEIAGYATTNSFGIYDKNNSGNRVQLFDGAATTSSQVSVSIFESGLVQLNHTGYAGLFSSNTFGFYIDVAATQNVYYSDTALNVDNFDHMLAYQGVGEIVDIDGVYNNNATPYDFTDDTGMIPAGVWGANEYILAFEDLYNGGDKDFTDMVIMVESVNPVPEPTTMILFGMGLIGLASVARRKTKV